MISATPKENESRLNETNYYICQKEFQDNVHINLCKVRDDCHLAGTNGGAVHSFSQRIKLWL